MFVEEFWRRLAQRLQRTSDCCSARLVRLRMFTGVVEWQADLFRSLPIIASLLDISSSVVLQADSMRNEHCQRIRSNAEDTTKVWPEDRPGHRSTERKMESPATSPARRRSPKSWKRYRAGKEVFIPHKSTMLEEQREH